MKNKNGYSAIELVVLIAILGVAFTIAIIFISSKFDDGKQSAYDTEIKYILYRATNYGETIKEELKDAKNGITITVKKIVEKGFLVPNDQGKIADPRNENHTLDELQIKITYDAKTDEVKAEVVS